MFASLKNKIREETGSDLSKITSKLTSTTVQRIDTFRGRHSRTGSTTSINSIISLEGVQEDSTSTSVDSSRIEDDSRKRMSKLESDYNKRLDEKENEWKGQLEKKDKKIVQLENDKETIALEVSNLKVALMIAEENKKKLVEYREDKEQIENFQIQELAKKNVKSESADVKIQLQKTEHDFYHLEEESNKLRASLDAERQSNDSLKQLIKRLEFEVNEEKAHSTHMQQALNKEISEKNAALLRNAEISQQMEMAKQETRRQEIEMTDLLQRVAQLEQENSKYKELENQLTAQETLKHTVNSLEEQLSEKNKNIKTLQIKLADTKKALQQEISNYTSAAILMPSQTSTKQLEMCSNRKNKSDDVQHQEDDINFKYLKHVIIKFLTSREYEAQHLTRAVATLLKFSDEEEKLLIDTLEWKMSWFGSKPNIGNGQSAKAIPPHS